ncbi:CAP domain-containing protein [Paenibacillus sepulcri]
MKIRPIRVGIASVLAASVIVLGGGAGLQQVSAASANTAPTKTYNININDTLSKLAQQYGIDLGKLLQSNPSLGNGNSIFPGMIIKIPVNGGYGNGSGAPANGGSGTPSTGGGSGTPATGGSGTPSTGGSAPANGGSTTDPGTVSQSEFASQVVTLVNQERSKAGLSSLQSDALLTKVATAKAKDMYDNNYFDHNSPTYGSPFDMMKQFGVSYNYAGENIAKGQRTPQEVMTAWMNSAGHKANILGANYKKIGVAYYNGEWVQEFTS